MSEEYDKGFLEGSEAQELANRKHIIEPLQAEIRELKERIEFAVSYLPESPNKALRFLEPVLKESQ